MRINHAKKLLRMAIGWSSFRFQTLNLVPNCACKKYPNRYGLDRERRYFFFEMYNGAENFCSKRTCSYFFRSNKLTVVESDSLVQLVYPYSVFQVHKFGI